MKQLKPVLSDAEIEKGRKEVFSTENPYCPCNLKTMRKAARWAEQAVLAKLAEQKPAMYARTYEGEIDWDVNCVSSDEGSPLEGLADIDDEGNAVILEGYAVMPLYAHPKPVLDQKPFAWFIDDKRVCGNRIVTDPEVAKAWLATDPDKVTLLYPHHFQIKGLADGTPIDEGTKEHHRTAKNSLEQEVLCMVRMLESREWADHVGLSELGQRLEAVISILHNELHEAQAKRSKPELARVQPCGCVVCYCENQERCLGCGAKYCGTHEVGEIPNPVYIDHIPDDKKMIECAKCCHPAIHYLVMDNLGYPNKTPLCGDCTQEHEHLAQDTNEHEMRNFGCAYGLVTYHYEPLANHILELQNAAQNIPIIIPDGWQLVPKKATNDMYLSFCHVRNDIEPDEFREAYRAVLEDAPKYTGDSDD